MPFKPFTSIWPFICLFLYLKSLSLNRFKKILKWTAFTLLFLIIAAVIFVNTDYGQNVIARQVTVRLSNTLKAKVSIEHVSFSLFNKMNLEGVYIEDQKKDTLLHAARVQVRITDWFFFKDKAELKYVGIEDATIHMNRTDSLWNYQFLIDYFSGGKSSGSKKGIAFDLRKLELKNVYLLKKDHWLGQDMTVRLKTMDLDANKIEFSEKRMDINYINFTDPFVQIRDYAKRKPKEITQANEAGKVLDSLLQWNAAGWDVAVKNVKITNGVFANQKESETAYFTHFDGRNFQFTSIDGNISDITWKQDTIRGHVLLDTKERSGLEVKKLDANMVVHPRAMEFHNMDLRTNNSVLRDYFAMRFNDFSDMSDFIHKVRMEASFTQTDIDSDDLAFFAPDASKWNKKIRVSGNVRGTVDDIFGTDMIIEAGRNTMLNGDISLVGLPDINRTFIDFKANSFKTTYADAVTFIPKVRRITNPRLQNISYLNFNGSFTGFIRDFVTYGTIRTNLGTITSDLNMKLPYGREPVYSGTISSPGFRLGDFIDNSELGHIAFQGKINGQGLRWNTLSANIDGRVSEIVVNKYHYHNVTVKGSIRQKVFNGTGSVNDSNARFSLSGVVDLSGKVPRFDFVADVDRLNLKPLNLSKENYSFRGKLDFDFSGDNIDNFLGDATITDALVIKDGRRIPIDSLMVNSFYADGVKHLNARSNEFNGQIIGDFSISDLPNAFRLFLNKYYPAYIKAPTRRIRGEAFSFDITTRYVDDYMQLIDSNIRGFNNSHITGSLNLAANQLQLKAEIPSFAYKNYEFQNVDITSTGDLRQLQVQGTVDNININDSLNISQTQLNIVARDDISDVSIVTTSDNKNIPAGNLKAQVRTYTNGLDVVFDSSNFVMNGKTWTIEKNGNLEFRSNTVASNRLSLQAGELTLRESNQEIKVFTEPSDIGNWNDIRVQLKNINIGDFSPLLLKSNRLEGLISGNLTIEDPNKKFNVVGNIVTDQLRIDNDSIGQISGDITYNNTTGELKVNSKTLNPNENVSIIVDIDLKDPGNENTDMIEIIAANYPAKIAERFIGTLFTDLRGYATGNLKIVGEGNNKQFIGKMRLRDAGLRVKFTQCFYRILDTEIEFKPNALDLGRIKLLDTITGNTATLSRGVITHDNWKNMVYDIEVEVDDEPIQLLNTGPRDNSSFYGRAKGTGTFRLSGPQRDMRIKVNAVASNTDSSYITLPSADSRESGIADFLIERTYGRELTDSAFRYETNVFYDVDLTGNPLVNVRVVLDELTGDEIQGRGSGNLRITSGTDEPLSLRGRYNIEEGKYIFTFQSFFKKPFELRKGAGNYIEWNGDPNQAYVKIDATYRTEKKVSFSPIINAGITSSSSAGFREYVYVIAKLRGDLFAPRITFDLDFPPDSPPNTDQSVSFLINQIKANENELNKQVAFLVVFNSFAPSEAGSSLNLYSGVDIVVNSISGFLSSQINTALNNFLSKQLKIPGLYVNFSGSLYNPNPFSEEETGLGYNRSNINVSLGKAFFNDRFIITFEGNLDVPLSDQTSSLQPLRSDFLKNVTTEWLINKSGTIRATFFYRENVDFLTGNTTSGNGKSRKYGASLAYRRDFNKFSDLFRRKKKVVPPPPVQPEDTSGN